MPSLSINFNPLVGPLVNLAIMPMSFGGQPAGATSPVNLNNYMALVDTGASNTAISKKVVSDLQLAPLSKQPVAGCMVLSQQIFTNFKLD